MAWAIGLGSLLAGTGPALGAGSTDCDESLPSWIVCEEYPSWWHRLLGKGKVVSQYPAPPTYPSQVAPGYSPGMGQAGEPGAVPPMATTPGEPGAAGTAFEAATAGTTGAASSGLGGVLSSSSSAVVMQGDITPIGRIFRRQVSIPLPPTPPERPPSRGGFTTRSAPIAPNIRDFKFADNQSPFPVDRVLFYFNFYDYVNQSLNQRFDVPLNRIQAYRYVTGFEKTFWDKNASFGMRLPINVLSAQSQSPGFGGTSTAVGDLSVYFKYALWQDREAGRVLSTGMAVTTPTGPGDFAGATYLKPIAHYAFLQPYLGFQWKWDRLFVIEFAAIDVPMGPHDATLFYNDLALGFFLYRNDDPDALLRGVAPALESHVNIPLNHTDWRDPSSSAGTYSVVDVTEGLNLFLGRRSILSLGLMQPFTGPRPASLESIAMLNVFF
jgi:hypothetical protein